MPSANPATNPTLTDLMKTKGIDGSPLRIGEALKKECHVLDYVTFQEGNLPTGHRIATETGIPSIGYRGINEGIAPSKFKSGQFDEVSGLMEGVSQIDELLLELNGNSAEYRWETDMRFTRAMKEEFESGFFYNSTAASPRKWNGLTPRYNALSGTAYAKQVIDGGGSASRTSVWLACFSPKTVYCFNPKGKAGGLQLKDMGRQRIADANGNRFTVMESVHQWELGVAVEDGEAIVRIANIDSTALTEDAATGAKLLSLLRKAAFRVRGGLLDTTRPAFFVNRTVAEYLFAQAEAKVSAQLTIRDLEERRGIPHYMGIPVVTTDAIINGEGAVS